MKPSKVVLSGGSGMIGTYLVRKLEANRISTIRLVRWPGAPEGHEVLWDPGATPPIGEISRLEGVDAAVHLSGSNIAGQRWTEAYKKELLKSRTVPTKALATALAGLAEKPRVLVCASAVGIYGNRGDEVLTEDSALGTGFLANACREWEAAARPAEDAGIRVVHLRFGVVLGSGGGALGKMLPVFKLGLGGPLGDGRQWMSWITLRDVARAILFAIEDDALEGAVNAVAPKPVTNAEFTWALGKALNRPVLFAAPQFALKVLFGEMAEATMLSSTRVVPKRLEASGFRFEDEEIRTALIAALADR